MPRRFLSGDEHVRRQALYAAALVVAVGVALIVVGVLAGWGQTRVFGALLITVGGMLGGAAIGFSKPARDTIWARLMNWRVWIAAVAAIVIAAPAILAMASATFGPLAGGGNAADKALVVIGVFVGLVLMIGVFAAAIIAVQATQQRVSASHSSPHEESDGEGKA